MWRWVEKLISDVALLQAQDPISDNKSNTTLSDSVTDFRYTDAYESVKDIDKSPVEGVTSIRSPRLFRSSVSKGTLPRSFWHLLQGGVMFSAGSSVIRNLPWRRHQQQDTGTLIRRENPAIFCARIFSLARVPIEDAFTFFEMKTPSRLEDIALIDNESSRCCSILPAPRDGEVPKPHRGCHCEGLQWWIRWGVAGLSEDLCKHFS